MEASDIVTPIVGSLVGVLVSGFAVFVYAMTNMVSETKLLDILKKRDLDIEKKFNKMEKQIDKQKIEIEELFSKDLQIVRNQMDYIIMTINEVRDNLNSFKNSHMR